MKYLKISNNTEIEENAFKLIGACTKRGDDSKIGYFGSGLKYALAVLLRDNIDFKVFSGMKEIEITVDSEIFREQAFNVISICGQKTSLTTSMGVTWKTWQAIREVFCNALDEEEPSHDIVEEIIPRQGVTSFYISLDNPEVQGIINNWDKYFAHKRTPLAGECCKIYHSIDDSVNIYRKGIRCWEEMHMSLYDYDFDKIRITESRTVEYSWEVKEGVAKLWGAYATSRMITALLELERDPNKNKYIESKADWNYAKFSDIWLEYFQGKVLIPSSFAGWFPELVNKPNSIIVDGSLMRRLKKQFGDSIQTATEVKGGAVDYCTAAFDTRQSFLLKECMQFFDEVKLVIPYEIKLGLFKDKTILGIAGKDVIVLSPRVFDMGKKMIVSTIIEECAHLESDQADETRGFQNYLINQIITLLENQHGIFL